MEWYIPITILPGIGLLILSTANILIALNNEIIELELDVVKYKPVIKSKLKQLKKLNYALIGLYLSAFALVLGGVLGVLSKNNQWIIGLVITGVLFLSISIFLLIHYSARSLIIRQKHLKL